MTKRIYLLSSIVILLFSNMIVQAALNENDYTDFANLPQQGSKTIAINIDPPVGYEYQELSSFGVSKERLHELMAQRLRDAGFNVISFESALEDPEAALLDLKIRLIMGFHLYYSYGLNLSYKQKVPLTQGSKAFYSVKTWSDHRIGGMQQSGLRYLTDYSMQLVDNFIQAHKTTN